MKIKPVIKPPIVVKVVPKVVQVAPKTPVVVSVVKKAPETPKAKQKPAKSQGFTLKLNLAVLPPKPPPFDAGKYVRNTTPKVPLDLRQAHNVADLTKDACIRPEIYLNNNRFCDACPHVWACVCALKHAKGLIPKTREEWDRNYLLTNFEVERESESPAKKVTVKIVKPVAKVIKPAVKIIKPSK